MKLVLLYGGGEIVKLVFLYGGVDSESWCCCMGGGR